MEEISFKERTKDSLISFAESFTDYFINYDYLICSAAFKINPYYIISSHGDNFKHLLGVQSPLSPNEFYTKAYNKSLTEDDFNFVKSGFSEKQIKGSVRRKINAFPNIINIFSETTLAEENFRKNLVVCSFAVGNGICTLGFSPSTPARPMSLLKGDMLNSECSEKIDLVFRRNAGEDKFTDFIVGNTDMFMKYIDIIKPLLSEELFSEFEKTYNKKQ